MRSACKFIFIVSLIFINSQVHCNSVDAVCSPQTEAMNTDLDGDNLDLDNVLDDICLEDLKLVDETPREISIEDQIRLGWKVMGMYSKMTKDQLLAHLSEHQEIYLLALASLVSLSCFVIVLKHILEEHQLPLQHQAKPLP